MNDETHTKYFVRVYQDGEFSYDVGPFDSLNGKFSEKLGAMEWLYQQIGLLKTHYPTEELRKESWKYQKKEGFFEDYIAKIMVHLANYSFEIFPLKPATFANVVDELIEEKNLPEWAKDQE
jgi:hypothetical protein